MGEKISRNHSKMSKVSRMDKRTDGLNNQTGNLFNEINALRNELDLYIKQTYNRINPLNENLIDWKERGHWISGHRNNTIYESSTIIGDVKMGDNCWIGPFTILDGGGGLVIGNGVTIAANAMIYTHDTIKSTLSEGKMPYDYAPVTVEDYCFIGTQAIILRGAHIGNHSLIAANALVSGEYPPYSIIAGSPSTIIGQVQVQSDGSITLEYMSNNKIVRTSV